MKQERFMRFVCLFFATTLISHLAVADESLKILDPASVSISVESDESTNIARTVGAKSLAVTIAEGSNTSKMVFCWFLYGPTATSRKVELDQKLASATNLGKMVAVPSVGDFSRCDSSFIEVTDLDISRVH
jgi:hypothetical protein